MSTTDPNASNRLSNRITSQLPPYAPGEATGQFYGLPFIEPENLGRLNYDNPEFLWPSKQYMDISGRTHIVQRGYMRSLITDPNIPGLPAGSKNRRLFFQFNPQVLVRSVQQTPGAMNPLLQDPAQLTMPVPGTASFGFELFFNREHEVAAAYNDPSLDPFNLPNGRPAYTSEVGVLADLLVLDTITGQGLSQDLVDIVAKRSLAIEQAKNDVITRQRDLLVEAGNEEAAKSYVPSELEENAGATLRDALNANLGNQAFLNPLPFRVMFSTLFMVEGIANSVDVVFQKFSRNMIPTQCKVTINMYALYIGFAKKKTFLLDNLANSAEIQESETQTDSTSSEMLAFGIKKAVMDFQFRGVGSASTVFINLDRTDQMKKQQKDKYLNDVKGTVVFRYKIVATGSAYPAWEQMEEINLGEYNLSHLTDGNTVGESYEGWEEFINKLNDELASPLPLEYLAFSAEIVLTAKTNTGSTVSFPIRMPITNIKWFNEPIPFTTNVVHTNNKQYTPPPPSAPRDSGPRS